MNKRVITVLVGTLLAFAGTMIVVPLRVGTQLVSKPSAAEMVELADVRRQMLDQETSQHHRTAWTARFATNDELLARSVIYPHLDSDSHYGFVWETEERWPSPVVIASGVTLECVGGLFIIWPIVLIEQVVIVLLAGGLLTWRIRRDRRRRAAAAT